MRRASLHVGRHDDRAAPRLLPVIAADGRDVADPGHQLLDVAAQRGLDHVDLIGGLGRRCAAASFRAPTRPLSDVADVSALGVVEGVAGHLVGQAAIRVRHGERTGRGIADHRQADAIAVDRERHRAAQRLAGHQVAHDVGARRGRCRALEGTAR